MKALFETSRSRLRELRLRHLTYCWICLFLFTGLGIGLETLLAYKVPTYIDVDNEARRLMWRLAHAHGTLLAFVHLGFSWTLGQLRWQEKEARLQMISWLFAASLLVPCGFFFGGINAERGDPGLAIILVPAGAVALLVATGWTAWELFRQAHTPLRRTPHGNESDAQSSLERKG